MLWFRNAREKKESYKIRTAKSRTLSHFNEISWREQRKQSPAGSTHTEEEKGGLVSHTPSTESIDVQKHPSITNSFTRASRASFLAIWSQSKWGFSCGIIRKYEETLTVETPFVVDVRELNERAETTHSREKRTQTDTTRNRGGPHIASVTFRHCHSYFTTTEIPAQQVVLNERMLPTSRTGAAQSSGYHHENRQSRQSIEQSMEGFKNFTRRYESKQR